MEGIIPIRADITIKGRVAKEMGRVAKEMGRVAKEMGRVVKEMGGREVEVEVEGQRSTNGKVVDD